MKQRKHFFYLAAMLLGVLTGCQEIEGTDIAGNASDEVELTASMEDAATRTLLSEDLQVKWVKNDKLAVFYGYNSPSEFTLKTGAGSTQGTFRTPNVSTTGTSIGNAVVAVYPYNKNAKLTCNEDGTYSVKTRFPAEQHYSSSSFGSGASPMMAISEKGSDLSFKNVGATIKMRVKSKVEGSVITKIVAYTTERDGQRRQLAGDAIYTMSADGVPTVELIDNENAVSEIVLICDDGVELSTTDVTEFYFTLPPMVGENKFEDYELVFELFESDRVSYTIDKKDAFECDRSKITTIGGVEGYDYEPVEKEVDNTPYVTFASENVQTLSTVVYDYSTGWWNPTKKNVPVESLEYSVGDGDWQALGDGAAEFGGANGDLRLRGKCADGTGYERDYVMISLSGSDVTCSGDIRTLIDYENYETTSTANARFYGLFQECTALTDASGLQLISNNNEMAEACYKNMFGDCTSLTAAPKLPATTLAGSCYNWMFSGCTSLTAAPELPATTLAEYCYNNMFGGCTSLTAAPELPATTLAESCYNYMFFGCTSLANAPELPATNLAKSCYGSMFEDCASLTAAPELPASTLAESCYSSMFYGCTSLTTAPELTATNLAESCYRGMFYGCTNLAAAPELPATTLAEYCYYTMFYGCTNLTAAPELPATTLANHCYNSIFSGCTNLTTAPELPATTLAEGCYEAMFQDCTGLTEAPALPATTLAQSCYSSMFAACTGLISAPELPATTLAHSCYCYMFRDCTKLTASPVLPALVLTEWCYTEMFERCTSLTTITMLATDISANNCLSLWVKGVASTGTFYRNSNATWSQIGTNGIPSGWTFLPYSE